MPGVAGIGGEIDSPAVSKRLSDLVGVRRSAEQIALQFCHAEKLVAFSCKGRGICPSCGIRAFTA